MSKPTIPAGMLSEDFDQSSDEALYLTWARRLELPINESTRATFGALLQAQLEDGWLN